MKILKPVVDSIALRLFHPNSNSFAKYYMYRCTKKGHRPKKPAGAVGWGFSEASPSPWGGVSQATGEFYR